MLAVSIVRLCKQGIKVWRIAQRGDGLLLQTATLHLYMACSAESAYLCSPVVVILMKCVLLLV